MRVKVVECGSHVQADEGFALILKEACLDGFVQLFCAGCAAKSLLMVFEDRCKVGGEDFGGGCGSDSPDGCSAGDRSDLSVWFE